MENTNEMELIFDSRSSNESFARVTVAVPSRVPRPMALPVPVPMMPRALPRSVAVVAAANPSRTAETPARPPSSPCARLVFRPHPHRTSSPFPHLRGGAFSCRLEMGQKKRVAVPSGR